MLNKVVKYTGWFLAVICVFYAVSSIVYEQGWNNNEPSLLDALYKAVGLTVGLVVYWLWFKKKD